MTRAEQRRKLLGLPIAGIDVSEFRHRMEPTEFDSNDAEIDGLRDMLGDALLEIDCLRADLREAGGVMTKVATPHGTRP